MRIAAVVKTSLFDGIGINYVIYFQGCSHKCEGCHNPSTHDPGGGYEISLEEIKADIKSSKLITGVTFSGGEPIQQPASLLSLAKWCKDNGYSTTLYTGFTIDCDLSYDVFDYIIDGKYECEKHSRDTPFRGSSNQRMLIKGVDYDIFNQ